MQVILDNNDTNKLNFQHSVAALDIHKYYNVKMNDHLENISLWQVLENRVQIEMISHDFHKHELKHANSLKFEVFLLFLFLK